MPSSSEWVFFQYLFSKTQFRSFLAEAGFEVAEEFVAFKPEGLLHCFGRLAGRFDHANGKVRPGPFGIVAMMALPVSWCGLMICYIVRKTPAAKAS